MVFFSDSTQLGNTTENSVVIGAIDCSSCLQRSFWLRCWVFYAVSNIIYVKSHALFTCSCFLGDSTQLCVRTEHSVERGAIANYDLKGRSVCIVGRFTPFSTSYMSNHTHCSHTHASWVIQPSYSIVLNTLRQREQLPALLSGVVLLALLGVLGRFPHHSSHTTPSVHTLVIPRWINPAMQ